MDNFEFTLSQIRYIISLYRLSQSGYGVKSVELANALGFSKPSVHNMLRSLVELGVVRQEAFRLVFFTERGRALAQKYAICYVKLEQRMVEICGCGAVSENAICGLLADMPYEKIEELYHKKEM